LKKYKTRRTSEQIGHGDMRTQEVQIYGYENTENEDMNGERTNKLKNCRCPGRW
jgi:hypothetical protein